MTSRSPHEDRWHWRNCRSLGIGIQLWLWPWFVGFHRDADIYGGATVAHIGPFCFSLHYSIGTPDLGGLSEVEAWERVNGSAKP